MSASIKFINIENFSLDIIDRKILNDTYNTIMDEQEISLEEAKTKFQEIVDNFAEFGQSCRDDSLMFYYLLNLISDAGLVVDEKHIGGWEDTIININFINIMRIKTEKDLKRSKQCQKTL